MSEDKDKVEAEMFDAHVPNASSEDWSSAEKKMLCSIMPEKPGLDYPLVDMELPNGQHELMYVVPPSKVYDEVVKSWPFIPAPKRGQVFHDLHSNRSVKVEECRIIRFNGRNIVVSPHYAESGGTVADLVDPAEVESGNPVIVGTVKGGGASKAEEDRIRMTFQVELLVGKGSSLGAVTEYIKSRLGSDKIEVIGVAKVIKE